MLTLEVSRSETEPKNLHLEMRFLKEGTGHTWETLYSPILLPSWVSFQLVLSRNTEIRIHISANPLVCFLPPQLPKKGEVESSYLFFVDALNFFHILQSAFPNIVTPFFLTKQTIQLYFCSSLVLIGFSWVEL